MRRLTYIRLATALLCLAFSATAGAQPSDEDNKSEKAENAPSAGGPPPAAVVVQTVGETIMAPEGEFLGTIYYNQTSEIAAEVEGQVENIFIEAGQFVEEGQVLARLNDDLLRQDLQIEQAALDEMTIALEKARLDLERSKKLFAENSVSEQVFDDDRFAVQMREKAIQTQRARIQKIALEIAKKEIRAPFAGAVLEKHTAEGEWLAKGGRIATIARTSEVDIIANVPQSILPFLKPDCEVPVVINGRERTGRLFAVVPQGDVATRTFPVRVRLANADGALLAGMEGTLRLASGPQMPCLQIPRDALLRRPGGDGMIVFAAENGQAVPHSVEVLGFMREMAGVTSDTLKPGMSVVVKGNERLRPGQPIAPRDALEAPSPASPGSAGDSASRNSLSKGS
ncbi:MAG: efflux RND transporter periplasmic adaptor subunit [Candidatus Sumerlaeia bacterium]